MKMGEKQSILIIDDELQIRRFLRFSLEANDYNVIESANGKDGLYQAAMQRPDLIILDLGLPDIDGKEVLQQIRQWNKTPVIVLSVRSDENEKVTCFDLGADDYVTKPFSTMELCARLKVALRHANKDIKDPVFVNGPLTVDLINRNVKINSNLIQLSPTEYDLLVYFVKNVGKVLTHRTIMKEIWGPHRTEESHYLRVYMRQIRRKLESDPSQPTLFITEPGVGYRMVIFE
jgi:two-component system, OmpR family, KDP operon response regulator KdpE